MQLLRAPALALAFALPVPFELPASIEDVSARLERARARHEQARAEARATLARAFEEAESAGCARQRLEQDRAAFEREEQLPASIPSAARVYEKRRRDAVERWLRELRIASEGCRCAGNHDRADELDREARLFEQDRETDRWLDLRCRIELPETAEMAQPEWAGPSLMLSQSERCVLELPAPALKSGEGYRVRLELERLAGTGGIQLLFPRADHERHEHGLVILDDDSTGLERVAGRYAYENSTTHVGDVLPVGQPVVLTLASTSSGIELEADGRRVLTWSGAAESLQLPGRVHEEFRRSRRSFVLVAPSGTSVRVHAAHSIELPPATDEADREELDERQPPLSAEPDPLARGQSWVGTWFDEGYCRVDVRTRDRAAGTAVLDVRGERGARFRVEIETTRRESSFKIVDIRAVAPPPGQPLQATIEFQRGTGSLDGQRLKMSWKARKNLPGSRRSWDTRVLAERR